MKNPHTFSLHCHPSQACTALSGISVAADFSADGALHLRYRITGKPLLPPAQTPAAADNLWQHTCCEAFIASAGDTAYHEFNFSPSGQWAAYGFTTYRQPDQDFQPSVPPQTTILQLADGFQLDAVIASQLLPAGKTLEIGLTAVIEAAAGDKTYWALTHTAEQADFHRRASFTLKLPRP